MRSGDNRPRNANSKLGFTEKCTLRWQIRLKNTCCKLGFTEMRCKYTFFLWITQKSPTFFTQNPPPEHKYQQKTNTATTCRAMQKNTDSLRDCRGESVSLINTILYSALLPCNHAPFAMASGGTWAIPNLVARASGVGCTSHRGNTSLWGRRLVDIVVVGALGSNAAVH